MSVERSMIGGLIFISAWYVALSSFEIHCFLRTIKCIRTWIWALTFQNYQFTRATEIKLELKNEFEFSCQIARSNKPRATGTKSLNQLKSFNVNDPIKMISNIFSILVIATFLAHSVEIFAKIKWKKALLLLLRRDTKLRTEYVLIPFLNDTYFH